MEEKNITEKFICWLNEEEIHYEAGYVKKEFQSQLDYSSGACTIDLSRRELEVE